MGECSFGCHTTHDAGRSNVKPPTVSVTVALVASGVGEAWGAEGSAVGVGDEVRVTVAAVGDGEQAASAQSEAAKTMKRSGLTIASLDARGPRGVPASPPPFTGSGSGQGCFFHTLRKCPAALILGQDRQGTRIEVWS